MKAELLRVLQVFGEPLAVGGQETFVLNMYKNIDRNKIQFDFFTPYFCSNKELRKEIEALGGIIFEGKGKFVEKGNKKDFVKNIKYFFSNHKYDVVHIHSGSIFALSFAAKIARKNGAKKVIVHSHSTGENNFKYKIIKLLSAPIFLNNATHYLACSDLAAEWKFPKKIVKNREYIIIKNGLNINTFKYDNKIREKYRKDLNLKNKKVICHVGRFASEKNHKFLIDIFNSLKSKENNAILLLVGDGPKKNEIEEKVKKLNLTDSVIFLGNREDVNNILQATDLFLFPSLFEGLGIAALEAQISGLPTICSNKIPIETNLTEMFVTIDLNKSADEWADKIFEILNKECNRMDMSKEVENAGYNSKESAYKLQKIYEQ